MPVELYELVIKGTVSATDSTQTPQSGNAPHERSKQAPICKTVREAIKKLKNEKER